MIMIKKVLIACSSVLAVACNNSDTTSNEKKEETPAATATATNNVLTDDEKKEGWQLLFDGATTSGWHNYGMTSVGSAWKVEDGALKLDASQKENGKIKGGGNLISDGEYDNFDLKLEWKIDTAGNSGIIFYVKEDTAKFK